jgi:DNA-binding CsgD family transcriptional regulator
MAQLTDRVNERARLDQLLADAERGRSAVLVLRGEAGIGKSALLEYAAERAEGWRVLRAIGAEWEMELPFAGLQQLCVGLLDHLDRLPAPQRAAVTTAFGLSGGAQPDRFLLGLAVLNLLSDAAEEHPLVAVVDDAQWLDHSSAQVLTFVARRLAAESVVLLFGERDPAGITHLAGLPQVRLGALPDDAARELLASVITAPMDERVRTRILAETHGNPLALLELPRVPSAALLADGFDLPGDGSLPERIQASFHQRVQQLPASTVRLLLVAAADPTGEPGLLDRAAHELGLSTEALAPAEAEGLLEFGMQVTFRHPLLRSAIYREATTEERREAHRALAVATDAGLDPDRRAWHRAHARFPPDEDIASELEQSAARAGARGGLAAAGAFLELAAAFSPDANRRARRALEAAADKYRAGDPQSALALLGTAAAGPVAEVDRAMIERLNGQILLDLGRCAEALPDLIDAARRLEPIDPDLAREAHVEAMRAACFAGRLGPGTLDAAKAARKVPARQEPARMGDLMLDALALRFTDGYAASVPAVRRAVEAVRTQERAEWETTGPWLVPAVLARFMARDLFDDDLARDLAIHGVQITRDHGALAMLAFALNSVVYVRLVEGDLHGAAILLDEADAVSAVTGTERVVYGRLSAAGFRGVEADALPLFEAVESAATARGVGLLLSLSEHARAVLYNSLGRYEDAFAPAQSAAQRDELWVSAWTYAELVEAAARCGQADVADDALAALTDRTRAAGTDWASGIEARCRALLSEGELADRLYREAIDHLARTSAAFDLVRGRLLYGEWLRRERRRTDARDQLRIAVDTFDEMGAEGFASRARRELAATGEHVRKRTVETRDDLTTQERQVAQLARDGLSNADIGARLFLSRHTVAYHLRKVFTKLGITSRNQLTNVLPASDHMVDLTV